MMREGWKEVEIKSFAEIVGGGTPSTKNEEYWNGDIPWITPNDLSNHTFKYIERGERNITDLGLSKSSAKLHPLNTILLTSRAPIGYLALAKNEVSTNQGFQSIRCDEKKADANYVYYALQVYMDRVKALASGATFPEVSGKKVGKVKLPLPPLETQKKIASILSGYDDLIENNLKRIKILEEMAQQTYEEWFVRMRFPGHESATINPETGLPEGWEKVKLGEMCNITMGQSPKSEYYNDTGDGLPFHQGVKDYGFRFPINKSWSTQGNKVAKAGSVLFSVRAPVGRINVASEEIILGRGLAAISHKKGLNSFLLYQLKNIFFEDNMIGGGAIYASVTKNDMERIEVIFCDNYAQKFNSYAHNIDQSILNLTLQNQRLREARDLLLPRLMMGLVEVYKRKIKN